MDSTDSPQFPSPLVMLIKFPNLQILSSRYRRKQTSLGIDASTIKGMLRNSDILPHSLELRRWDVYHPYMTKEDVIEFKKALNAIAMVGLTVPDNFKDGDQGTTVNSETFGVQVDIRLCSGLVPIRRSNNQTNAGLHWVNPTPVQLTPSQATQPAATVSTEEPQQEAREPCGTVVWALEKCHACNEPQTKCWKCQVQCHACHAPRSPPYINHQLALDRQRSSNINSSGKVALSSTEVHSLVTEKRPRTPPGSISLSMMSDSSQNIMSAYISPPTTTQPVPAIVNRLPEFSLFD
jgi:hypothetical protein